MRTYVVDASIILKWVSRSIEKEENVDIAKTLYLSVKSAEISLFAPTFLLVEVINILSKKKKFSKAEIVTFLDEVISSGLNLVDFSSSKIYDLLDVSLKFNLTPYDSKYLLLAQELGCQLISDDKKLVEVKDLVIGLDKV